VPVDDSQLLREPGFESCCVVLNLSNNNIVYLIQRHIQLQNVCGSLQHVHLFIHLKYIGMILKYKYILAEYS